MSRKTTSTRTARPTPSSSPAKARSKATTTKAPKTSKPPAQSAPPPRQARAASTGNKADPDSTSVLLARAEADISSAIDSLNNQMNAALSALTEVASAQCERGRVVVRTAPLDRATATFHRLVNEVVDDHLSEMLPPLAALRNEMAQKATDESSNGSPHRDLFARGAETIDHVLTLAGAERYEARIGQNYDPLIHLAVGETNLADLGNGVVSESLQPGFRSTQGKVIAAARVRINRR